MVYRREADLDKIKKDCAARDGVFNDCGDPCAPEVDFCIEVCAYVCEFENEDESKGKDEKEDKENGDKEGSSVGWVDYFNNDLGFSLIYPDRATTTEIREGRTVRFMLNGPTQEKNTELFDGLSFVVSEVTYDKDMDLEDFVKERVKEIEEVGEVIDITKATSANEQESYIVKSKTLGTSTKVYIARSVGEALIVSYSHPDPTGKGYGKIADKMLDSFQIFKKDKGEVDGIEIFNISEGDEISSGTPIKGRAEGSWYFEGEFPVVLTDWDGRIIAETSARAQSDWMTEDFVPFEAKLEFEKPDLYERGSLILQKANPSGLPENDEAMEITVNFK